MHRLSAFVPLRHSLGTRQLGDVALGHFSAFHGVFRNTKKALETPVERPLLLLTHKWKDEDCKAFSHWKCSTQTLTGGLFAGRGRGRRAEASATMASASLRLGKSKASVNVAATAKIAGEEESVLLKDDGGEPVDSVEVVSQHSLKMGWLEKETEESYLGGWNKRSVSMGEAVRCPPCAVPRPSLDAFNLLIPTDASLAPWQICRAHRLERAGSALVLLQDRDR